MSGQLVQVVHKKVPPECLCLKQNCRKHGCGVSMKGAPTSRVVVDMDCDSIKNSSTEKQCDYLFVGKENNTVWVAPIELKSGGVEANKAAKQLQRGANTADKWLPSGSSFRFVPVVAHAGIHPRDKAILQKKPIKLRGQIRRAILIRCGKTLREALDKAE